MTAENTLPMHADREVLTYSALNNFRNCARKFDLRYQHRLKREIDDVEPLFLGTLVHDALETLYARDVDPYPTDAAALLQQDGETSSLAPSCDVDVSEPHVSDIVAIVEQGAASDVPEEDAARVTAMLRTITQQCPPNGHDAALHARWHQAVAMCRGYVRRWRSTSPDPLGQVRDCEYELLAIEQEFVAPIVNPETNSASRSFVMAGKVDGVIRLKSDGRLYLMERKTASTIDSGYLAKLWTDFQSMLYAHYLGKTVYHEQFAGVLYDVIGKQTRCKQKEGESDMEFAERLSSYKTAKTREKHLEIGAKPAESDAAFHDRLMSYLVRPEMMHRELILFDPERLAVLEEEIWDLTKQLLAARQRGRFSMNTSHCYVWGRGCDFTAVCRRGALDDVTRIGLAEYTPHRELSFLNCDVGMTADDVNPIF